MDNEEVDHYAIVGVGCGSEIVTLSPSLSEKEITKAYRCKARQLHPDKRPNDPNAHTNFLKLQNSYQLLKNHKSRKLFDDDLLRRIKLQGKKMKKKKKIHQMKSDLEERERRRSNPSAARQEEEERISRQLKQEISRIIAMHQSNKNPPPPPPPPPPPSKQDTTPEIRYPSHFESSVLQKLIKASRDQGHLQ